MYMSIIYPDTHRFHLSKDVLIQLGVISKDFPKVRAASEAVTSIAAQLHVVVKNEHNHPHVVRSYPLKLAPKTF